MEIFKFCMFSTVLLVCMDKSLAHTCNDVVLQSDVDHSRLNGEWRQAYHSRDSRYDNFECFNMRIFGISKIHKLFYAQETIHETRPKIGSIERIVFSTMCWENCVSEREIHVDGHIATDYDTYMIIHTCLEDHPIIDIEIRKGIDDLSLEKVREISGILDKIQVNFFALQERDRSTCPPPRR
ncbi:uncharacterized protein LOC120334345 [Styela clava]|uniref:uncharacterized protein LOC120334345 n=1 Tax=Styela clava TaxID=7725 RepID=UPI001939D542|nr:uncharacterized protein LOC120334345 [Styela clava]